MAERPWVTPEISIHALREEGDEPTCTADAGGRTDFYPRPPRGGRRHDW